MTDAEYVNALVDAAHKREVLPQTRQAELEVMALLEAIAEGLREEGLCKVIVDDKYHVLILDHPGFDYSLMVFAGRAVLSCNGHMKFFELADPNSFTQIAEAARTWCPMKTT